MYAYGRQSQRPRAARIAIVKTVKLSDGRYLAYDEYGDFDGTPVIFNDGLADSRLIGKPNDAVTASLGVRQSRPTRSPTPNSPPCHSAPRLPRRMELHHQRSISPGMSPYLVIRTAVRHDVASKEGG